jgi:hypothetical protein
MDARLTQIFLDGLVAVGFGAIGLWILGGMLHEFGGGSPRATPRAADWVAVSDRQAEVQKGD